MLHVQRDAVRRGRIIGDIEVVALHFTGPRTGVGIVEVDCGTGLAEGGGVDADIAFLAVHGERDRVAAHAAVADAEADPFVAVEVVAGGGHAVQRGSLQEVEAGLVVVVAVGGERDVVAPPRDALRPDVVEVAVVFGVVVQVGGHGRADDAAVDGEDAARAVRVRGGKRDVTFVNAVVEEVPHGITVGIRHEVLVVDDLLKVAAGRVDRVDAVALRELNRVVAEPAEVDAGVAADLGELRMVVVLERLAWRAGDAGSVAHEPAERVGRVVEEIEPVLDERLAGHARGEDLVVAVHVGLCERLERRAVAGRDRGQVGDPRGRPPEDAGKPGAGVDHIAVRPAERLGAGLVDREMRGAVERLTRA